LPECRTSGVLEIGVRPGVSFTHYDPATVSKAYALEANPVTLRRAQAQWRRTEVEMEFLDLPGERKQSDIAIYCQPLRHPQHETL
jgi:hypothetical protein